MTIYFYALTLNCPVTNFTFKKVSKRRQKMINKNNKNNL